MASPLDFIRDSIEAYNGSAVKTSSTPASRTSAVEDYYNEQMQKKQATEKARDVVDGRGRGHVGGLRDAWLDKNGEAKSTTVDSRGNNSMLRKEYQRQNPNTPTMSTALSDDEKFQLQSAYADAASKYKSASKKAQSVSDKKAQSIRPEAGVNYATTLEKYRSELQAASDEKAAAESEMNKLRKQLEFYKVEIPDTDQNIFERLWGSVKGGSKQAAGSLGGAAGYTGRTVTGAQNAVDKALRASGNEELSALYHVGAEEEDEKAMQMQQALADKSAELSESGGRDIERSKWGASDAGRFALDAVSQVPALAADMAANAILPGSGMAMMMGRSFGGGVQEAEAGGANLAQAGAYGAASAAVESLTEKLTGGLDIAYGKGFTDKVTEKLIGKFAKTDIGRTAFRAITGALGEGAEEFISSAVNPTIRAIYNGKSIGENYSEEQVSDWLYDGLVGAALGIAGSGVSIATGADAKKNAELRSGSVDSAIELMTGKKAASEPQSAAETAGDITTPPTPSNDAVTRPETLNSAVNNNAETQNADVQKNTVPNGAESNIGAYIKEEHHGNILDGIRQHIDEVSSMESVAQISGNEFQKTAADPRPLRERVIDFFSSIGNKVARKGFGDIALNNAGVRDSLGHGYGKLKAATFAALPDVLRDGKIISYDANYKNRGYESFLISAPVEVGNETVYVGAYVIKDQKTQRYKVHEVLATNKDGTQSFKTEPDPMGTDIRDYAPSGVDASLDGARRLPNGSIPGGVSSDASEVSTSDNSIPTAEQNVNRGQTENSANADFRASESDNARSTDATQDGSNTQDANSNYNADNTNYSTGSNTAERVYVDENGNEYDPKTGYTTRTAEEVQAEHDAHISDDLYYTLRAEDRLTPDNAKEWAQWQRRREERQNAQKAPVTDETAWKDAEAEFGGANHDAIHKATQRAEEFETFLESDAFTSSLTDEQYTKVSDSVTEFKNKLAGLGDGRTSFAEFAEYYKAMKDSRILGDLYSERVNEQVQLARELAEEAYSNPIPHNVEKYRHAAVKAAQMTSHYIEKASKVRVELDELNNAVKENGSKRKPAELGREVERGEKGKSLREKAAAKFIRWQIMPRQMFQMIDGFKFWEKGAGYRMADTIENAAAKNQTTLVEADNFFTDVVKMKGYGDFATGKTKTSVRLGGKTLTMSEAVSLYKAIKTMGGPDAYRVQNIEGFALKNGDNKPYMIKADPANIFGLYSALQTAIAKNEVASAYIKAFDSMSEKLGKETQNVAKAIDGVDNELFKPGDYFPLTYARVEDGNFEWDKADSKDFGVPDFKNLKERTRTAGGYVNIAPVVEVTDSYIRRAADYIAFGELADTFGIMDYMHTFGTPTLVDSVKQNMGSEYGAWMENYVKDVQDINQTRAKSRDNWWQKLNHNFQTAVLIGNPGTPFKQKGSMWLAMSELDPRAVAKAAVTSLNPGNQQMKAARNNPLLQFRAKGNIDSSITDALQDQNTLFSKIAAKSKVLKSIQNWIPAADVREISKVYLASCYDVQMKNPGIDVNSTKFKEMVDETFQRASMRTQSQYTMNMRDEISRGDSALLKALTMFQTQQRTTANNMFTAINEAIAAKGTEHAAKANKALKNAAAGFFASNVAYAAMDVLAKGLRHKLKQFRDDDEEQKFDPVKIAAEVGKSFADGVGGTVIFGDDVANFILSVATGETFYENGIGAIGAIEDAASAFWNLTQNPSADNIRKTAGGFANLAGIPLNNAYTLLNSMGMYTLDVINAMNRSKESGNILNELLKGTSAADIAGKKKAGLYSISDDPADDFLKIIDSIRKAVDKLAPDQFTYTDENGDEANYELTKADKKRYRKDAEASYNTGMDALLATAGYRKLDTKDKKAVDKSLRDYAKNAAEQGYLGSKGLDHDTGASAWMRNLSEDEVPKYLVAKQTLKGMYKDGKISDFAALDSYMDDLKNGFTSLTSAQRDALSDSFPRIKDIYDAAAHDIPSKKWAAVYDKYMELDKTREDGYNATDKATDLAAFIDKQGLTTAQAESLKEQFGFYSHIAAEPTKYEKLIDAGYSPDKANELYYRLDNMSTDGNDGVSQEEAYARLSTMDDLTSAEKDAIWAIINSGWKTTYTKYDRRHRNDTPAQATGDTGSTTKSTSTFTMEDYYRALGLLK